MDDTIANPAELVLFKEFCKLLDEIKISKSKKEELLCNFLNQIRSNCTDISRKNLSFFPILRLLLPKLDRERPPYNLKEEKLRGLIRKMLGLHKDSPEGKRLLKSNDFAGVVYFALKTRGCGSESLTIKDINDTLDKIAFKNTENNTTTLDDIFSNMLTKITAEEYMWFLHIILKDLKLGGLSSKKILEIFHPDASELYDQCSSLLKVCEELSEGNFRPAFGGVEIFFAVSPMRLERLDIRDIRKLSATKNYHIETKFDGERFQLHMKDGKFEYFSRKGFNFSHKYGNAYDTDGLLTPLLKGCISAEVNSVILDGEMMGWHKEKQIFGSKGQNFDVKNLTKDSSHGPCFCVFDILYYNGKPLISTPEKGGIPLCERIDILEKIIIDKRGIIMCSKRKKVEAGSDIIQALEEVNAKGDEGIVVKEVDSYYIPNTYNGGWYKIKPEYTEGMMTDLDMVIVGGDYAESKSRTLLKSFFLALLDDNDQNSERWLTVGRVATGLSFEERERLCNLLERYWQPFDTSPPPTCLAWGKEKPDLWIHPQHSYVLQVRATELIRSQDFATEYTLRFPRVEKIRDDKPVKDILTLNQFMDLVKEKTPVIKLSKGKLDIEDVELGSVQNTRKRASRPIEVAAPFRKPKITDDEPPQSRALVNRKLTVLSDDADCSKERLENIIRSHSGTVVPDIVPDLWCCVAGVINDRVENAVKKEDTNIVATNWLRRLPNSDQPCALPQPLEFIFMTVETRAEYCIDYDNYGDSYTETVDKDLLKKLFDKMDFDGHPNIHLMNDEMSEVDQELFNGPSPFKTRRNEDERGRGWMKSSESIQ